MNWRTQELLFRIAELAWIILVNVFGFIVFVAAIAFGVLIALRVHG